MSTTSRCQLFLEDCCVVCPIYSKGELQLLPRKDMLLFITLESAVIKALQGQTSFSGRDLI